MTPKKQLETCAICLDDITIELEVKLDSCNHRYCGPCITKWVKNLENICPLCKQKVTKITSRDVLGRDVVTKIEDKTQHNPEVNLPIETFCECEICVELLTDEHFNLVRRVIRAVVCNYCGESGIHVRCMNYNQQRLWQH